MRDTALDIELSNLLPSESRWLRRKSIVAPVTETAEKEVQDTSCRGSGGVPQL
jgi:hypothetical protein